MYFRLILFFILFSKLIFPQNNGNKVITDSLVTVEFSAVGDIMCHETQLIYAKISKDSFDFKSVFEKVKPILENSDFAIGNLETAFAGKESGYSGYPKFNTPDEFLEALKYTGFDLMITANNHSIDMGVKGLERTIDKLDEYGIYYNGTYKSKADQDSIRSYNVKGIESVILSYSYGSNVRNNKKSYSIMNFIDTLRIKNDIVRASATNPDLIIVYYHFGDEYKRYPSADQRDIVKKTIEYGADIILGSHTHVIQPVEFFKTNNGRIDTGFVAYSLGNFISNQRWRYTDSGVILNFSIIKEVNTGNIKLARIDYIPTWVYKGYTEGKREFKILPLSEKNISERESNLTKDDFAKMKQSYFDTMEIITKFADLPR